MSISLKAAMGVAGLAVATAAGAQVTLYSHQNFRGEQFTANGTVRNMDRTGFNDRASSAVVNDGAWQVCEDAGFNGRCVILRPGEYRSLSQMGLQNRDLIHSSGRGPLWQQRSRPRLCGAGLR